MEKNELAALQAEMNIRFTKYELPKEIRFLKGVCGDGEWEGEEEVRISEIDCPAQ